MPCRSRPTTQGWPTEEVGATRGRPQGGPGPHPRARPPPWAGVPRGLEQYRYLESRGLTLCGLPPGDRGSGRRLRVLVCLHGAFGLALRCKMSTMGGGLLLAFALLRLLHLVVHLREDAAPFPEGVVRIRPESGVAALDSGNGGHSVAGLPSARARRSLWALAM